MDNLIRVDAETLARCLETRLHEAGVAAESAAAAVRAMLHASLIGVDSHGARLVEFYCTLVRNGRINPRPNLTIRQTGPATAIVDGEDGLGHLTSFRAMDVAATLARTAGIGAVAAVRSSHFGAAGAYAKAAADAGLVGIATGNADSLVALFGAAAPFHGTNPIAVGAPVAGSRPWLLDMATSSVPFNRVLLFRSLGRPLPDNVAADAAGRPTTDAEAARMLMPVGGVDFGFKGAALAGFATLLSAILTGMTLDHDQAATEAAGGLGRPPRIGAFFIAIDPDHFVGRAGFDRAMTAYLAALRAVPAAEGAGPVMAPGDREWAVEIERRRDGIPLDPKTAAFLGLDAP